MPHDEPIKNNHIALREQLRCFFQRYVHLPQQSVWDEQTLATAVDIVIKSGAFMAQELVDEVTAYVLGAGVILSNPAVISAVLFSPVKKSERGEVHAE